MPATLVVIDMQPDFDAANELSVIVGVANQIWYAQSQKWPIMLVEYRGCGDTHDSLANLLRGYPQKARISKNDDDGSLEIVRCLRRRQFPHRHLRICGVNADCCVYETVEGLLYRLTKTKIEVAKDATGTEFGDVDWRRYLRHPRLSLVSGVSDARR